MSHKKVVSIVKHRFKIINTDLQALVKHFDAEDIHRFRVEVKKLRAVLHILNKGSDNPGTLKMTKNFRAFYNTIGELRNIQLQKQRIYKMLAETSDRLPTAYLSILDADAKRYLKRLKNIAKQRKIFEKNEAAIRGILNKKPSKIRTASFYSAAEESLRKALVAKQRDDATWHLIRKLLKDILYAQSIIGKKINGFHPEWLSDQTKVEMLCELLGEFQDACTGLNFLKPPYTDKIPENERIVLINIENEWENDKQQIRQRIYDQFQKLRPVSPAILLLS